MELTTLSLNTRHLDRQVHGWLIECARVAVVALVVLVPASATAQEPDRRASVPDAVRSVLFDPTTYAPAVVTWESLRLDWRSSQIFFENGWVEQNRRYTISGLSNDIALSQSAGSRQIVADSLQVLQFSLINNVSSRVVERLLIPRYPTHRKLIRAAGWVERTALASLLSYRLSASHFRQWRQNDRRAREIGLK